MPRTLYDKIWDEHVVHTEDDGTAILYIDRHLVHEVTSPQAFDGLRLAGRQIRRPELTIATEDHNVPTVDIDKPIADPVSRTQVDTLRRNCEEFGIRLLERVKTDLLELAVVEQFPKMEGRQLVMVLAPKKVQPKSAAPKNSPKAEVKAAGVKPAETPGKVAAADGAIAQDAVVVDKK